MSWLFENPWPILIGGVCLEVALVVALVRTGRAALLAAIAGVGVLAGVLLVVERMVVTEKERVESTLDDLSRALVTNDLNAVLEFISPSAPGVRALAQQTLPEVKISKANVGGDLEIKVNERADPPTADATFTGLFSVKLVHGSSPHETIPRRFRVRFAKEQDRWRIIAVEDSGIQKH